LQTYLQEREVLLVLDNFEQILAATPIVADLLTYCRRLKVLVTSRASLHLYGEQEFPVPPLALPGSNFGFQNTDFDALVADQLTLDVKTLAEFAAIELFCQRVKAVKPDFALTPANAADVAKICIGLDGLPLAIELAAARIKFFSPSALFARLKQRLTLLIGGAHDLPARQRTLRHEIAWSYDLLTPTEQTLFRRLAVFVGGFTLEAAQAVGDANGDLGIDVQEGVTKLLDYSLLKPMGQTTDEVRFGMLETVREYGLEQLTASGEAVRLHDQHTTFFLALAEKADRKLRQPKPAPALQRLEADAANLRAALAWSLRDEEKTDIPSREGALRLVGALSWFWHVRTRYGEARTWSDRALALSSASERGAVRARALQAAGLAAQMQGDFAYARTRFEESLVLWRELGAQRDIAFILGWLAWVETVPGNPATARPLAEASVALFRELGDVWGIAFALETLGAITKQLGDLVTARTLLEESVLLFREVEDIFGLADALGELAGIAYELGDYQTARHGIEKMLALLADQSLVDGRFLRVAALHGLGKIASQEGDSQAATAFFAQSLTLAHNIGNSWLVARASQSLGLLAQKQGQDRQAIAYLYESLASAKALRTTQNVMSLIGCIGVAANQQQWERAAQLGGAVETLSTNLDRSFDPLQETESARILTAIRIRCDEPHLIAAWRQGQAFSLEQAIQYASATLKAIEDAFAARPLAPETSPPATYPFDLSAREVEVLRLLAQRLTYLQIAEKLVISQRTVNAHVTSIYSKLGVNRREAAIRFAVEHHLV
jgi:predicted ATPase/DNA-binding CsgD family transcriptional regulator